MAGRNYLPPQNATKLRHSLDDPRLPSRPQLAALEDRAAAQRREIQSLLGENQRLHATHVALEQELSHSRQELRRLSSAAAEVKARRDAEVREVYERSLKMEAEVREINSMADELERVSRDALELGAERKELAVQLRCLDEDVLRAAAESEQVPLVKSEIEAMREEIQRGRAALEREKQTQVSNLEQAKVMEKHMLSLKREIEKLHVELANAERRSRGAAAAANLNPGYAQNYSSPEIGFGGSTYPNTYEMHQGHVNPGGGDQYGPGIMLQEGHAHR
ncbi:hypothetical protein EUGRSUZ_B02221 [Eucalyptus grandis]|uniref:Uncharacterized protein n=2 Tax=Eucalyptus grandis TaxID=71139 RepID=A0ACC3LSC0_EUCGR|nr:hypothetical protein EUGRSUZ_B02221 [Eucalyptus grandis]